MATRNDRYTVILDGVRSPMGVKKGKMIGIRPDDLTAQVIVALLKRNPRLPVEKIEDVVLGCAFPEASQGMLMARGVAILAGIPKEAGAKVVNRFCGSSMDAAHQIDRAILVGDIEAGLAAGVEDMFSIPMGGFNPDFHPKLVEQQVYMGMGETAEILAREGNISREEQEQFSISSHKKALEAWTNGRFANEVVPVTHNGITIDRDEGPREPDIEKMKSLEPAFLKNGTITAATSSPISIGAAALLLASNTLAQELDLKPRARIVARAFAGVDWKMMGMGPLPATEKALKLAGMTLKDIDVIELNEAFAAQSLYVIKKGGWPMEKINLNGGAIALGHPLGASGARILVTLLNVMEQKKAKTGLATMCIGMGQGIATIIERL
ncbi:MAG: thiolase family protein [candidate division KSB1 bacterium]|nr:thiolase family protein [candidate division KSB1 bacterium]MDZ7301522.1 thiolase family protein [candidate division KSB1 bacterium]MDZ7311062.1 thiolase family protein [candidate division KSB1 bacterium]